MRSRCIIPASVAAGAISALAAMAAGHPGPRVWVANDGGAVTTYTSDNDLSPTTFAPSRLFTGAFEELLEGTGIYGTDFPGYEVKPVAGGVSAGTAFAFNIAGPLLIYDSASHVFRSSKALYGAQSPQVAVSAGPAVRQTGDGVVEGFEFFNYNAPGDHGHLFYTLFGDGSSATDGPAGVYALPLELISGGLGTSATYYLLLGKGLAAGSPVFDDATSVAAPLLDRRVTPDDYFIIDRGYANQLAGYLNGDLDRNGLIDGQDYFILDSAFVAQGGLPTGAAAPAAVPEPVTLGAASLGATLLLRRRTKELS